jgi:hypothetical protein
MLAYYAAAPAEVPFLFRPMRRMLWARGFVGYLGERGLGIGRPFELRERSIVRRELQAMQYAMHSLLVAWSF